MSKITPLYNNVVVEAYEQGQQQTPSGILIAEGTGVVVEEVKVLAIGCGTMTMDGTIVPPQVKVGDKVLIPRDSGIILKAGALDSKFKRMVKENEIIGVVGEE